MTEHTITDREKAARTRPPTHPGAILRDIVLPDLGLPKAEIARLAGISRTMLYDVLNETAKVTPILALRFGKLLGMSAETLLRMQASYDLWEAGTIVDTDAIPRLESSHRA